MTFYRIYLPYGKNLMYVYKNKKTKKSKNFSLATGSASSLSEKQLTLPIQTIKLAKSQQTTPRKNRQNLKISTKKGIPLNEKKTISTDEIKIVDEESMNILDKQYQEIKEKTQNIMKTNHSLIWSEMHITEIFNKFDGLFKAFIRDSTSFYQSIKKIEDSGESNRIANNATLKATTYSLLNSWKEICGVYEMIQRDGINSLIDYIQTKFNIVSEIIRQIVTRDSRNVHKEKLELCGSNLKGIIANLSKSVTLLLSERDLMHEKEYLIDGSINDIKSFIKIYNEAHYHQFTMSSFMQSQLVQFRANVLTACNDIIVSIKAAFSFDDSINEIIDIIENMTSTFNEVITLADMPPSFVRSSRTTIISRSVTPLSSPIKRKDPIAEVKEFTSGFKENGSSGISKLECFISDVAAEFELKVDKSKDVWDQLNDIKSQLSDVVKRSKELNSEHELFVQKMRNQSKTVTWLMREKDKKEIEYESMKNEILERNVDLEERNEELTRQINEALTIAQRRETQLFQIRENDEGKKLKKCLMRVAERLESVVDKSEVEFSFADDDLITRVDKLTSSISLKKCSKCREREVEDNLNAEELSIALDEPIESFNEGIKKITREYSRVSRELEILKKQMIAKDKEMVEMRTATNEIKRKMKEIAVSLGQPFSDDESIGCSILLAFNVLEESNKEALEKQAKELQNERVKELMNLSLALNLNSEESKDTKLVINLAIDAIKENNDTKKELNKNQKQLLDINNFLEGRTQERSKEKLDIGDNIMFLMDAIEKTPNKLSTPYNNALNDIRNLRTTIETGIAKLAALIGKKDMDHYHLFNIQQITELLNKIIDNVRDVYDDEKEKVAAQENTIESAHNSIAQLIGSISSIRGKKLEDISSLTFQETIDKLNREIEQLNSN